MNKSKLTNEFEFEEYLFDDEQAQKRGQVWLAVLAADGSNSRVFAGYNI
jgi:hypothetical protein